MQQFLLLLGALFAVGCSSGWRTNSPSGNLSIELILSEQGSLSYRVCLDDRQVVDPSALGLVTANCGKFESGLRLVATTQESIDETYTLPTGKTSTYINRCNQTSYLFENSTKEQFEVITRAYDDGVAFRYKIERPGDIAIAGERTRFEIPQGATSWIMDWVNHNENFYPKRLVAQIEEPQLLYPALMQVGSDWVLLTEASVYNQPATHLSKVAGESGFGVLFAPENPSFVVENCYESPWRTFIVGSQLASIVGSVLVENLNPPSKIKATDWIKPGVVTFPWWGDNLANSYIDTLKMYTDLAAEMGWEWIEFDVSLVGTPLRTSSQWRTTPWLQEFCNYAKSKGVMVYGWDEIAVLDNPSGRDYVYGRYRDLGIDGIKIDYINSDSQYAMKFRDTASSVAAEYQLMVSYHGETIPRGQRRTYPNVMTLEAVRGAEWYQFKGHQAPSPEHNCTLPFTRNVVGSMDYTPTTFTIRDENPRTTTYAHELALPFVFESGWVCMADRPEQYLNSPAKEMLKRVEATWDETRLIDGYPGQYVVMARRKGKSWYLSGLNANHPRVVEVKLGMLPQGQYTFTVWEDPKQNALSQIDSRTLTLSSNDVLRVEMPVGGGFCTVIDC